MERHHQLLSFDQKLLALFKREFLGEALQLLMLLEERPLEDVCVVALGGVEVLVEVDAELVDVPVCSGQVVFGEVEVSEAERGYFSDDSLVVRNDVDLEGQVLAQLALVLEVDCKLLLQHLVLDSILDGHDEATLLLDEAAVDLAEVAVALVTHEGPRVVPDPAVHGVLVVEHHHLRQYLVDGLLSYLLLQIPRQLDEAVIDCEYFAE